MTLQSGAENYQPADEDPVPGHAKKDTRHWCKGKPGKSHTPVIEVDPKVTWIANGECRADGFAGMLLCKHHQVCSGCGKVFLSGVDERMRTLCPDLNDSEH